MSFLRYNGAWSFKVFYVRIENFKLNSKFTEGEEKLMLDKYNLPFLFLLVLMH